MSLFLLAAVALLEPRGAIGGDIKISNENDFKNFVSDVNSGKKYEGVVVYLENDLSLSGVTNSIGESTTNFFLGTFDGQGHVIKDFKLNTSSSRYTGLFGYSSGLTIKNVILDSSCSITNSYNKRDDVFIGGIIGYCKASDSKCNIENCVNMASVTFKRDITEWGSDKKLFLGGIAGRLDLSSNTECVIKNCANYGPVTNSGKSGISRIGGILGLSSYEGSTTNKTYIQNCLNYGVITHNDETSRGLYLGGIVGRSNYCELSNCLSAGRISSSKDRYKGSIVGYVQSDTTINNCYYSSDTEITSKYGYGTPSESNTSDSSSAVDSTLAGKLNNYASNKGWNKWLLNTNSKTVTFKVNGEECFSQSTQVLLLPYVAESGANKFEGWFSDTSYSSVFTTDKVSSDTTLYGLYGRIVTVKFDGAGGIPLQESKSVLYNKTYGDLPDATMDKHTFIGWFTEKEGGEEVKNETRVTVTNHHTLYAHWISNIYTVTFNVNGGNSLPGTESTKEVTYNEVYGDLPTATRTGYTFIGWYTEFEGGGEEIKREDVVKTTENQTLYAHWSINQYTITFEVDGGSECKPIKQDYNTHFVLPEPTKTGYTFDCWCSDPELSSEYTETTMPAGNVTLYAKWIANKYTVTFNVNGGNKLSELELTKEVTFDNTYETLPTPTRTWYTFLGWFTEEERGEEIKNGNTVKITANKTLYAHWIINKYTITFNTNGGTECKSITQDCNTPVTLPTTSRTGYTFVYWCSDSTLKTQYTDTTMPGNDIILYAKWTINKYTLTFVFNNGTENEVRVLDYNSPINYPENVTNEGYSFIGWDNTITSMPAHDLTISAQWESKRQFDGDAKSKSGGNGGLVAGIVIPLFLILIALVALVLFILFKKGHLVVTDKKVELAKPLIFKEAAEPMDRFYRVVARSQEEVKGSISAENSRLNLSDLFPREFSRPTMREALLTAELTEEQADLVCDACDNAALEAKERGALFEGFTEEDAAAVAMYTYDFESFEDFENDPFRVNTKSLTRRNYASMQKASGMLYLVVASLRKLPRVAGVTLYRGVRSGVKLEDGYYHKGNVVTWSGLTSTSPDMEETKALLMGESKRGRAKGTLFVIENGWGYDIQPFSMTADDEEIVIEPERRFMVMSVIKSDLTVITLQMLDTPLSLQQLIENDEKTRKEIAVETGNEERKVVVDMDEERKVN